MAFEVANRIVAESESTDRRPHPRVIEEVLPGDPAPRYRMRWDDGHEIIYDPAGGALRPTSSDSGTRAGSVMAVAGRGRRGGLTVRRTCADRP
jgi:Domain of unknown function (DUF1918)